MYNFDVIGEAFSRCEIISVISMCGSYIFFDGTDIRGVVCLSTRECGSCMSNVDIRGSYGVQETLPKLICDFVDYICLV